jgi:hypothetical protein
VTDNRVITVNYRDPKYAPDFIFPARKLEAATEPPKVLKQGVDQGNPNYRPVIGFNHNRKNFANIGDAGHRQVNHYTSNRYAEGGNNGELYFIKLITSENLFASAEHTGDVSGVGNRWELLETFRQKLA